jgi:CRP-like cAMP-binding protein
MTVGLVTLAGVALVMLARTGALASPRVEPARVRLLGARAFAGLPPGRLEPIARELVPLSVVAGETVVEQGAPSDRFYLIESGRFEVSQHADGQERILRTIGPADVFGEIGLLTGGPRTASVKAVEPGRIWALEAETFLQLVQSGPGLSTGLLDLHRGAAPLSPRPEG